MTKIETIREYGREVLSKDAARSAGEAVLVRLASRLYALRTSLGLTQEELAARTGLDQASISDIENGDANPTVRTLGRLAAGLNVNAGAMLEHTALGIRFGSKLNLYEHVEWQGADHFTVRASVSIRGQTLGKIKSRPISDTVRPNRQKVGAA